MIGDKSICVVVPAYNEETQILKVLKTMPDFVDRIVVVDDFSQDKTAAVVSQYMAESKRVHLISHDKNQGVGAAIRTGYIYARDNQYDCTAVMAGDGQMDPGDLAAICRPVIQGDVDYCKGNRLIHKEAKLLIPKTRFFGNSVLSLLTKIASGYWQISDTQTGYTAISKEALMRIEVEKIYPFYGMPNDMLVKLNTVSAKIKEVPIRPVYNVGEKSKMRLYKVIPKVSWLLIKLFFKRLFTKYLFRDFHPLFLFYCLFFLLFIINIPLTIRLFVIYWEQGVFMRLNFIAVLFCFVSSLQSLFFAMWFDMDENRRLIK